MINNETKKTSSFTLRREGVICLFLVIVTLAVYWQVGNHAFVNYDDIKYVTENRHVQAGLTLKSVKWAFTATHASNWHPLTWLSHMADCQIYGLNPRGHHLTNVLFHILNSILLFIILRRITGSLWKSAFVAALFALHPLHVESVAWVAERKDVLSTFFWMLTMGSYIWYVERPGTSRYLLVLLLFILGLMAKPMLVTLPFVLLLLDYWPLGRFQVKKTDPVQLSDAPPPKDTKGKKRESQQHPLKNAAQTNKITGSDYQWSRALPLIREKIPFFVLAATSSVVTFFVQQSGGAVRSFDVLPLTVRIFNALVSYVSYIGKMIWPLNLAVLYPYYGMPAGWKIAGACLLLAFISFMAIRMMRQLPYFIIGWLWYLGTLVPVIGIVQVGSQAMADRYTYVPLIGIFIIIVWGVSDLAARWRYRKEVFVVTSAILLSILTGITLFQLRHWTNSITLFKHAINVTDNNAVAHNNLGFALFGHGRTAESINHYNEALKINPDYLLAHMNLGSVLAAQGRTAEAIDRYNEALKINPDNAKVHNNLGSALIEQNKTAEAIDHYTKALKINPDYADVHYNWGNALAKEGRLEEAVSHYHEALRINPDNAEAHNNLGNALFKQGKLDEAVSHYYEALRINPDAAQTRANLKAVLAYVQETDKDIKRLQKLIEVNPGNPELHYDLGNFYYKKRNLDEAIYQYQKALSIQPDAVNILNNLAIAYMTKKEYEKAVATFDKMVELQPDNADIYYNIACMYSIQNKIEKSLESLKKAVEKGYDNWDIIKTDQDLENIRNTSFYKELMSNR
ncbi:MAG: tetratricopeptide repeat protein [Syntrophales bacterium]|nr:tetratricopeptide repeat protein [Syntrophales bacterium]